jgi:hypothetical protein
MRCEAAADLIGSLVTRVGAGEAGRGRVERARATLGELAEA